MPLFEFFDTAKHRRNCQALDDALWLEAGVRRCLSIFQSGRNFLQHVRDAQLADQAPDPRRLPNPQRILAATPIHQRSHQDLRRMGNRQGLPPTRN